MMPRIPSSATDDSDKFIDVYPDYDFACIARWAWAAMRAVDYLYTLPDVDREKIGITGHSRNGKQSLLAASFDERIGAVVGSSGTTGECLPGDTARWITGALEALSPSPVVPTTPTGFIPACASSRGEKISSPSTSISSWRSSPRAAS